MISPRDELKHLADTLTQDECERALEAIRLAMPELYPDDEPDPDTPNIAH
jgi:hypothetical protein